MDSGKKAQVSGKTIPTPEQRLRLFSRVTNVSRGNRLAKALLGPLGRVWQVGKEFKVGEQLADGGKEFFGVGETLPAAFVEATDGLTIDDFEELAGPEFKALLTIDERQVIQNTPKGDMVAKSGVRARRRQAAARQAVAKKTAEAQP